MGFGINWTGAAAGYNAYRDEQRRQEDTERRHQDDLAKQADRAFQDEERSRQRYEWSEADRIRNQNKARNAQYISDHRMPGDPEDPAPAASTDAATDAPAAAMPDDGGPQTAPVADPAAGITPIQPATTDTQAAPIDASLAGAPAPDMAAVSAPGTASAPATAPATAPAVAPSAAPAAAPAPPPAGQAAPGSIGQAAPPGVAAPTAAVAGPLAPVAGIPKPRQMGSILGMYENALEGAAKNGDVNPQAYLQTRELLNKMRTEGVTQAMEAFSHGDFAGGMALYNGMGTNRGKIIGTPQQATTTLPNGMEVPTWRLTIANEDGSRAQIDTAMNQYQMIGLKDRLELMDKAAQRKSETDYKTTMAAAATKQADTMAGYREDQATNMKEQRRLQEEALKAKQTQSAEQAANWTKEADAFLVNTIKTKNEDGNEVYDGDGLTFAKTVGMDYARKHGGDAMSGAGVAVGVNNQLKALAAANVAAAAADKKNPKKLDPVGELSRVRAEYLKHASRATPAQGDGQPAGRPGPQQADFAGAAGAAAKRAGEALGVDPNVVLGQWGLETAWGKSVVPGTNNYGNIKDFSGAGVEATDNQTGSVDKYQAFDSPDAFADRYVDLIRRKYPGAMGAGADAARFGAALKAGGYAQDPDYAAKVQASYRMLANKAAPTASAAPPPKAGAATRPAPPPARAVAGEVPTPPPQKVWQGNNYIDNPAYTEWVRQYADAWNTQATAFAHRMERATNHL